MEHRTRNSAAAALAHLPRSTRRLVSPARPLVALLATTALVGAVYVAAPNPAHADGGNGGPGNAGQGGAGGRGGTGYMPPANTGGDGGSPATAGGGSGGGGGASSGTGGADGRGGAGGNGGGTGGDGGTAVNPTGGTGGDGSPNGGAGGGGGGYNGNGTGAPAIANAGALAGGMGGNGGGNADGGGGGGSGGYGAVVTGATANSNTGMITGGTGGIGGAGYFISGQGGGGGVGLYFATGGATLNNTAGSIMGGNGGMGGTDADPNVFSGGGGTGGAGGTGVSMPNGGVITNAATIAGGTGGIAGDDQGGNPGTAGVGGIGVVGAGLTINNNGGTIQGGRANGGNQDQAQAYAIQLTGGTNSVSPGGFINGGINVQAGATLAPAISATVAAATGTATTPVGTPLFINGPLAFASTSTYQVRISPTLSDSVIATTATLAGAVKVVAGAGTYAAHEYLILTTTAPGGYGATRFTGVTSNLPFFTVSLRYDMQDQNVFLDIVGNAVATQPGGVDYRTAAVTQNQRAVATGLTVASNLNGNSGPLLNALNQLTVAQARAVFDSLSGEGIAATQNLAHRSAQMFGDAIFDQTTFYGGGAGNQIVLTAAQPGAGFQALAPRSTANGSVASGDTLKAATLGLPVRELADLPRPYIAPAAVAPTRTWRAWGSGFGGQEDIHSNQAIGFAAQSNQIYGGAVGVDYQINPSYLVGVAVGGSDGEFNVPNRATSGSTTGGHIAVYDIARFGAFYGASSTSASFYQNRTTRNVAGFGGLGSETEKGSFASHEFRSRVEFGRDFVNLNGFGGTFTPFVALEIAELRSNGFGEQTIAGGPGGPGLFALNVSGQSTADVPGFVGARFSSAMTLGNGMVFRPTIQAAYVHEFATERQQFAGLAALPGATFLVDGARPARNAAQVKAGGELAIGPRAVIFANFDGEFSGVNQLYGGKGGIKIAF